MAGETFSPVDFVMQYGGRCRDCADHDGVCPGDFMPCHNGTKRSAVAWVIGALEYGRKHGYIVEIHAATSPLRPITPLSQPREGLQLWEEIVSLFARHGLEPPPWRLRDELVTYLAWARYGSALATQHPPKGEDHER